MEPLRERSGLAQQHPLDRIRPHQHLDDFECLLTVRLGPDPARAPLDGDHRFRGIENLLVTDGSALPRSAGVNPSLTIAALALRAATRWAERRRETTAREAARA